MIRKKNFVPVVKEKTLKPIFNDVLTDDSVLFCYPFLKFRLTAARSLSVFRVTPNTK